MATKTIGQLTQATTINPADEFAIEQSGVTKRVAASVVRGDIIDANIKSDAAIAFSKLAALNSAQILVGNGSNVPTAVSVTGDVTISNAGVTAIAAGAVVTADVADAAITAPKLSGAQTGSAPIYGCRAWVNFDGTTSPATIRASGNVTSVTKNATGDYTINFTTAMSDANYSAVSSVGAASSTNATLICAKYAGTSTSASFRIQSTANASSSTYYDLADISVQFFR